jgi:hypothetical protein
MITALHRASALFVSVLCVACSGDDAVPSAGYPVLVRAVDDLGKPLPGVQLSAAERALGVSDARGELAFSLPGAEGQRVDLTAACPQNYAGPRERPAFLLKRVRDAKGEPSDRPIDVSLTCDATSHVAVVALQTGQAGLPVMLRGQVVAQTSDVGTAHVMLREPVGNSFQLTLDTSARPELRPENPTRLFAVTHQDAFSVWEQGFEEQKRVPASAFRKKGKRRAAAGPTGASKRNQDRSR